MGAACINQPYSSTKRPTTGRFFFLSSFTSRPSLPLNQPSYLLSSSVLTTMFLTSSLKSDKYTNGKSLTIDIRGVRPQPIEDPTTAGDALLTIIQGTPETPGYVEATVEFETSHDCLGDELEIFFSANVASLSDGNDFVFTKSHQNPRYTRKTPALTRLPFLIHSWTHWSLCGTRKDHKETLGDPANFSKRGQGGKREIPPDSLYSH